MAATAILFQVCHQCVDHRHVLHHIMNTQFKFGDDRLNGSKVTAFCSKFQDGGDRHLFSSRSLILDSTILTSLERAYVTS